MARIVAIGHVGIGAKDLASLATFYRDVVGLRQLVDVPGVVAIYTVGDADLFISPGAPAAEIDLASDDVDGMRARLVAAGVECGEARDDRRSGHRSFPFTDPDGNRIVVTSAHLPDRGRA